MGCAKHLRCIIVVYIRDYNFMAGFVIYVGGVTAATASSLYAAMKSESTFNNKVTFYINCISLVDSRIEK